MFRLSGQKKRSGRLGVRCAVSRPNLSRLARKSGSCRRLARSLNTPSVRSGANESSTVARVVSQSYNQATADAAHRIPTRCVSEGYLSNCKHQE